MNRVNTKPPTCRGLSFCTRRAEGSPKVHREIRNSDYRIAFSASSAARRTASSGSFSARRSSSGTASLASGPTLPRAAADDLRLRPRLVIRRARRGRKDEENQQAQARAPQAAQKGMGHARPPVRARSSTLILYACFPPRNGISECPCVRRRSAASIRLPRRLRGVNSVRGILLKR